MAGCEHPAAVPVLNAGANITRGKAFNTGHSIRKKGNENDEDGKASRETIIIIK